MKFIVLIALIGVLASLPGWTAEPVAYRFSPGDLIEVTVTPQRNLDRTVTVQPDGRISFPRIGPLQAAGLTIEQLAEGIREALNRELVDPSVTVSLKEAARRTSPRASLLGAARSPGVFDLREGATVAELLALAGGPAPRADLRRVTITRLDGSVVTVDLAQAGRTGRLERNERLQPGDLVVVPEGTPPTVLVLGEVVRPGSLEIQGEMRLLDAISQTGGLTPKADLRRVMVARPGAAGTRSLDLRPLLSGQEAQSADLNPPLQPGDTIVVAESEERVSVVGRVARPDLYPIKPGDRVLDALVRAGGPAPDGDLSRAVLVRQSESGQRTPKPLDLKKILATGDVAANETLRPGDILFVPDKKSRRTSLESLGLLLPVASLINLFR